MSKFYTVILVCSEAIARVRDALPEGTHLERVRYDTAKEEIVAEWDHHGFKSGRDFHIEFPLENLEAQKLPEGIALRNKVESREPRVESDRGDGQERNPGSALTDQSLLTSAATEPPAAEEAEPVRTGKGKKAATKKADAQSKRA